VQQHRKSRRRGEEGLAEITIATATHFDSSALCIASSVLEKKKRLFLFGVDRKKQGGRWWGQLGGPITGPAAKGTNSGGGKILCGKDECGELLDPGFSEVRGGVQVPKKTFTIGGEQRPTWVLFRDFLKGARVKPGGAGRI